MARASAASKRYAEALMESVAAEDEHQLSKMVEEVGSAAGAVDMSRDLEHVLLNPAFSDAEKSRVLAAILQHMGLSERTQRFLALVTEKGRLADLSGIADHLEQLAEDRAGRVTAVIETATQLNPPALDQLRKALEKRTGKSVEMEVRVDPSLIGGLRVRMDTYVLDGTIRSEIDRLKARLMAG